MNWRHLQAFVWLRWRLMVNQWRRAGKINAVLMILVACAAIITSVPLFIGAIALGTHLIPEAQPAHLMYAWDGLVIGFLFFWCIGLITELQRSDPLSLFKFLHLPVSVHSAFLINYLSSLVRLTLIVFIPLMLGFSLALIYVKGIGLLPVLPLLAAFVLMVTGLTYQFQGWLASMMSNPRRRRTIVAGITMGFVLFFQLPNLLNLYSPWGTQRFARQSESLKEAMEQLDRTDKAENVDAIEHLRRQQELMKTHQVATQQAFRETAAHWEKMAALANLILPIGWLPLSVKAAAEGALLPSLLGILGMSLIGSGSLWRAYHTTIRQYQGQFTSRKGQPAPVGAPRPTIVSSPQTRRALLMEARLPGLSEPVSAVALGGFRALMRSPEAKMMLMTPLIMNAVFGSMLLNSRHQIPELTRPLVALGGMVFVLLGMLQLTGNQFGFDRDGFRVFVLSSAPRRDILLGKNLAFAPIVLMLSALLLALVQFLCPLRLDHLLSMIPQYLLMYLLFCLFTNLFSIYAPIYIPAGALKPANPRLRTVLLQLLMFLFLFPLTQVVSLLPLGVEAWARLMGWTDRAPICLVLSLVECVVVVFVYRVGLQWQGKLLQSRERDILECVTSRVP
jgi:ABC-2 type transport system permease protein